MIRHILLLPDDERPARLGEFFGDRGPRRSRNSSSTSKSHYVERRCFRTAGARGARRVLKDHRRGGCCWCPQWGMHSCHVVSTSGCPGSDFLSSPPDHRTPMSQNTWKLSARDGGSRIPHRREVELRYCRRTNMGVGTVKSHLRALYGKLGVSNRTQAALVGYKIFPMLRVLAS